MNNSFSKIISLFAVGLGASVGAMLAMTINRQTLPFAFWMTLSSLILHALLFVWGDRRR